MKNLNTYITEKILINKTTKTYHYHYYPTSFDELKELVDKLIKERGNNANLNDIDTSEITDMAQLFYNSKFNGDISGWDVSNVEDMDRMFAYSSFNGNISDWDISNVKNMNFVFDYSHLEKNPPKWYKK